MCNGGATTHTYIIEYTRMENQSWQEGGTQQSNKQHTIKIYIILFWCLNIVIHIHIHSVLTFSSADCYLPWSDLNTKNNNTNECVCVYMLMREILCWPAAFFFMLYIFIALWWWWSWWWQWLGCSHQAVHGRNTNSKCNRWSEQKIIHFNPISITQIKEKDPQANVT